MTENRNQVTLSTDIESIKSIVHLKSYYAGSRVFGTDGASQESKIALTASENDFFEMTLREAATNVYDELQSVTRYADVPFTYDVLVGEKRLISYQIHMSIDWDTELAKSLIIAIEKAFSEWVLQEWYKLTSAPEQFAVASSNYALAIENIHSILLKRKKPVSVTYRGL